MWLLGVVGLVAALAGALRIWLTCSFPPSERRVYREIDGRHLWLHIFEPVGAVKQSRPAIVFFFGGAWSIGTPAQFFPFCRYFADQGIVAISVEYRIRIKNGTGIGAAFSDARAAVRWVREHAARYGIDPSRLVLSGGSSGGHLAAAVAMIPSEKGPTPPVAALVLFNPVTDLGSGADASFGWRLMSRLLSQQDRDLSPVKHVTGRAPPTVIFHGDRDGLVPVGQSQRFRQAMLACRNICELHVYRGRGHAFFNYGLGHFEEIAGAASSFIRKLGLNS